METISKLTGILIKEFSFKEISNPTTDNKYFSDSKGNQIKIDLKLNSIKILDKKGLTIRSFNNFAEDNIKEILNFYDEKQ